MPKADNTYISLLRAVNVSGQNKIPMQELKSLYESLGLQQVTTYIQSGNVVFRGATVNPKKLAQQITQAIKQHFGYPIDVLLWTQAEFAAIVNNNPFSKRTGIDPARLHTIFLKHEPAQDLIEKLPTTTPNQEEFFVTNDAVYLHYANGTGKSKLHNNFFEKALQTTATTRNWNTVNKLLQLAETCES